MKNISVILNILLLVAVGYLYYLHFSCNSNEANTLTVNDSTITVAPPKEIKASRIVYINADSLFDKYQYVIDVQKSAEGRKSQLEKNYNTKMQLFQEDYMAYQQKASQGTISFDQAKATEDDLMKRRADLEGMEDELSVLVEETQKKNAEIQKEITAFLAAYNKNEDYHYVLAYTAIGGGILYASNSLDITAEVIEGLNKSYAEKKKNKATSK